MRLSPGDELDLQWFHLEAAAALGERSPFGVQLEMARDGLSPCGASKGPDMDRAAAVIRRYDEIRARLEAMPRRSRQVLVAAYCREVDGLRPFDRLGPVLLLTVAVRGAYKRALDKADKAAPRPAVGVQRRISIPQMAAWLVGRFKGDGDLKDTALGEADAMLTKACEDWRGR